MESSDEEASTYFIKNISKPILNAEEFLKENGIVWPSDRPGSSKTEDLHHDEEHDAQVLKNLTKAINDQLGKEDSRRDVTDFRNTTSLLNLYFTPKTDEASTNSQSEDDLLSSFLLKDGMEFLTQTFPKFDPSTLSSQIKAEEKTPRAMRIADIAEMFGLDETPREESSKEDNEAGSSSDSNNGAVVNQYSIPEDTSTENKVKNKSDKKHGKQSKDKKCEYEKMDIEWTDPGKDEAFRKELEEIMGCDRFRYEGELEEKKPALNYPSLKPLLPRDIISVLTSANDTTFANWEYSVKLDQHELTSDESDIEEIIQTEKTKLLKNMSEPHQKIEHKKTVQSNVSFDPSNFLQNVMPQNCEEFISVRDDEGRIISYDNILRSEEHLIKEYELIYVESDPDSDDSDDEEEPEDDPEAKAEEIEFKNENVREGQHDEVEITQAALLNSLDKVEAFAELVNDADTEVISDTKFKEEISSVNKLLDTFGVPQAVEIEDVSLDDIIAKELNMLKHLEIAHENITCPPGKLEEACSSDDEDDKKFKTLSENSRFEEFKPITRPDGLSLNISQNIDPDINILEENTEEGVEAMKTEEKEELVESSLEEEESISEDENEEEIEESLHDIAKESEDESYSSSSNEDEDEDEKSLDDKFLQEYLRRGGSVEGLGEYSLPKRIDVDTLKSYCEKFNTYPFLSKYSKEINMVRMRRILAKFLPELEEEAYADLSKELNIEISEPELSSSDDSQVEVSYISHPMQLEDFEKTNIVDNDYDNDFPVPVAEGDEPNFDPIAPKTRTYEELVNEVKEARTKKLLKRKMREKRKLEENKSSDDEEGEEAREPIAVTWKPFDKLLQPSRENIVNTLGKVHKILKPRSYKFKTPKGVRDWVKGEYIPSKDELMQWKKQYTDYYGKSRLFDDALTSEDQAEYEKLLERIEEDKKRKKHTSKKDEEYMEEMDEIDGNVNDDEGDVDFDDTANELNFLMKFKMALERDKLDEKEENEIEKTNVSSDPAGTEETSKNKENNDLDREEPSGEVEKESSSPLEETETPNSDGVVAVIKLRNPQPVLKKEEWAEEVNCHKDFEFNFVPALTYSFELDGFQKQAIAALERGFNVFVSAHTSAGKTVVAEYAIAMSKRNRSRAIYTSPVKALSNQKYADFKKLFGSVGLITGDIQLNENAECLIMTTEILRSMLYNCSEKIRDLQYVIFDEVHYINDPERGHVWEEVLILLSSQVQIVMLSATVPNTMEFANWVGRTKQRKVIVCATQHRPVPLNHYLYTGTGGPSPGDTYLLKSGNGNFLLQNYLKAEAVMKEAKEKEWQTKKKLMIKKKEEEREWKRKGGQGAPPTSPLDDPGLRAFKKDQTMWISLISFLKKKDWLPAVSFVFSRMKCDAFANMLSTIDLTTKSEKSFIHKFIKSQIEKLDDVDQDLPQIQVMKRQLDKGIGIHHSGILPVMKEIVEVLFQEGKVKLLFATETFAMGVNMPARTVIFHSIRKFDGNDTRLLLPAEYVQMAGRAGRRGKDSAGNVLILAKPMDIIPRHSLETLLFGNPCKLTSKFRLTYRMILNTLTVSGMLTVQNMMEQSYCENQGQLQRPFIEKDLIEAELKEKELKRTMTAKVTEMDVESLAQFFDDAKAYIDKWNDLRFPILMQTKLVRELYPGKLIKICIGSNVNRTGMLLEAELFPDNPSRNAYKVLVLDHSKEYSRHIAPDGRNLSQEEMDLWYRMVSLMKDLPPEFEIVSSPTDYSVLSVKYTNIVAVFRENVKFQKGQLEEFTTFLKKRGSGLKKQGCDVGDTIARLLYAQSRRATEIEEKFLSGDNYELVLLSRELWILWDSLQKSSVSSKSQFVMEAFRRVFSWKLALSKVNSLKRFMSIESMSLYPDFINKLSLLKEKGYISDSEQVLMKGYMAARIGKYELIVCEMLFENVLVDLAPEEVAALLSFLVFQNNSDDIPLDQSLPVSLKNAVEKCKKIMLDVTTLEKSYDIRDFDGSEINKLKFGLVPVMYAWAKQEPLKKIMEMELELEFQEGMLVRWIQQLLETLKEVEAAARLMGDPLVPEKLQAAGQSIKRGIVFAPSLYTTMV